MIAYIARSSAWMSGAEHTASDVDNITVANRALIVTNYLNRSLLQDRW
jgi:hypothetical protein